MTEYFCWLSFLILSPYIRVGNLSLMWKNDYVFLTGVIECVKDPLNNNACGQVTAYDLDLPPNALIMYTITGISIIDTHIP